MLDGNFKTFVVYIVVLEAEILILPSLVAQIAIWQLNKVSIEVLARYTNYTDVFFQPGNEIA